LNNFYDSVKYYTTSWLGGLRTMSPADCLWPGSASGPMLVPLMGYLYI